MKKRLLILMTVTGMIILLGGLLTYGLGVHEIIPVPRPDLIVVGTSLIGILLIVSGVCDLFVKKTKEMEIEENDERNISLSNAAMASGFKVMNVTIAVSIFALIFTGYMTVVPCFTIIGAYAFDEMGVKKLPKVKELQTEYAKLLEEKKKTYAEYRRSREEMRELLTAKANVDRVLKMEVEQDVEKEKDHGQR